jgi:hypothetical protein
MRKAEEQKVGSSTVDDKKGDHTSDSEHEVTRERDLSLRNLMRNPEDGMKDFQKIVALYRHVNLLGSEGKRKREKSEVDEDLPGRIHSSNQDPESAPIMTAWAVPSAEEKRRRKRRNRRIRDRLGI